MTKKNAATHYVLHVTKANMGELLVVEASGKIRLKGKEVSMEEFIRFLQTYENGKITTGNAIALIGGAIGGISTDFFIRYLQTQ